MRKAVESPILAIVHRFGSIAVQVGLAIRVHQRRRLATAALRGGVNLFTKQGKCLGRGNKSMAVIWLPDDVSLPNKAGGKRKRWVGEEEGAPTQLTGLAKVAKSRSFTTDSCSGSSRSKASARSTASSQCSFPAFVSAEEEDTNGRVRIAVGGV